MAYELLRRRVLEANLGLQSAGLVVLTWGNASAVDRAAGVAAIKPSGVRYESLTADDIVVVSLEDGRIVDGEASPSSDTPTHLALYRDFPELGGVVHTHSVYATSWAQACRPIPCLGTTHADHFFGPVPVTRRLEGPEIADAYEERTGALISEHFREHLLKPLQTPAVLVPNHGPFVWGQTVEKALENAVALEAVARMAYQTLTLVPGAEPAPEDLVRKHFDRKHGPDAYYGQRP